MHRVQPNHNESSFYSDAFFSTRRSKFFSHHDIRILIDFICNKDGIFMRHIWVKAANAY